MIFLKGEKCENREDNCVNSPCLNGGTCANRDTDFVCECTPGWTGKVCEENLDECNANINPCLNGAQCIDTPGHFR